MKDVAYEKAEDFALKVIKLCKTLQEKKEFIISNQLFRSGTSVGANIAESEFAASKADFANKLQIALKEANESRYWLSLLLKGEYINKTTFEFYNERIIDIISILVRSIKTSKGEK